MLRIMSGIMGALCVLCLLAPVASAALAPFPPQDALYGTWSVSSARTAGDLATGVLAKAKALDTWTITASVDNVVKITGFSGGPNGTVYATYEYGVLFFGIFDDVIPYAHTGYAHVTGKAGKLALQGEIIAAGSGTWGKLRVDAIKGKQLTATGAPAPGAAADAGEPDPIVAGKAPVTPPLLADLYNTYWAVKGSRTGYDFTGDHPTSGSTTLHWHMTKGADAGTVHVDSDFIGSFDLTYFNGILIRADGDTNNPASVANSGYLVVSGKAGAMKIVGSNLEYQLGGSDDYIELDALSGKQTVGP